MIRKNLFVMLLALILCSMEAWSYRITDNYTIESKFKINAIGAGIAFRAYEGFNGQICVWQFNVGTDGTKSLFRPHDWKVGGILLAEINTADKGVTLNTTDWFVTKIVITGDGGHATTYLRRADDVNFVEIDSRDGNFRYGLVGTRQDHDGDVNESATYDYFRVTANNTGEVLYYEDFEATNGDWNNNPTWADGAITTEGRNLQEVRYFPNNMFKDAVKMHYALEADVTIKEGYVSFIFGMNDSGSNYMWQISPNYRNNTGVCNYYHLDNGNESWKAHAAGPDYPDFEEADFREKRHVMIEVVGNVVNTYIDGQLEDSFVQCDMTDLALLNTGKMGIRVDAGNSVKHEVYVDNVKLTEYDKDNNATVVMVDGFDGGAAHYFELSGKNAAYAQVVDVDGDYALHITCDGTTDKSAKVRLIQTDDVVCTHNYENGFCTVCGEYEEPGYNPALSAYTIGNLGQLIRFSQIVNGGEQGANGSLTADIDMENSDKFQPIGLNNDGNWQRPFMGKFYGNNHVISNLYVKTDCEGGLFSRLRGGYIENLGLVNGHIESTANLRCGAMAGEHHDNAEMVNCYARGNFEFATSHAQKNAMAGETAGGHFINCYTTLPQLSCSYPMGGDQTNSYEGVNDSDASTTGGELCYNLGSAFHQALGTDTYPGLDISKPNVYKLTVSNAGYASFVPEVNVAVLPTGVTAYVGQDNTTYLHLEKVTELRAENAFIVKAAEGNYYYNDANEVITLSKTNDLKFYTTDTESTGNQYCLADKSDGIGFYQVQSGILIPARKAFLQVPSPVKAFYGFDEDDATLLKDLKDSKDSKDLLYNLAGQRIQKMQKGINIIGGKKIVIGK